MKKVLCFRHFQNVLQAHFTTKKRVLKQVGKAAVFQDLNFIRCIKEIHVAISTEIWDRPWYSPQIKNLEALNCLFSS